MVIITLSPRKPGQIVRQIDQNFRAELPRIGRLKLRNVLERVVNKMRGQGKKITYPVKWDSAKQRRAYFATKGFGRGIPTQRTGAYIKSWEVVESENGIGVRNKSESAKYIGGNAYGLAQSKIHKNRWRLLRDVVEEEIARLPEEMRATLFVAARRVAKETV